MSHHLLIILLICITGFQKGWMKKALIELRADYLSEKRPEGNYN